MLSRACALAVGSCLGVCLAWACISHGGPTPSARTLQTSHASAERDLSSGPQLGPPDDQSLLVDFPTYRDPELDGDEIGLFAYHHVTHVYMRPARKPLTVGLVRRGTLLRATKTVSGAGCPGGKWYVLASHGYVCLARGFTTSPEGLPPMRQPRPAVQRALPYLYGKVSSREALRYYRMPSDDEYEEIRAAVAQGKELPDIVVDRMDGDYFLALDREESIGDRSYHRTVLGRYVPVGDVDIKPTPKMQGELLGADKQLPLAFVHAGPATQLLRLQDGEPEPFGQAHKHARFEVADEGRWSGRPVVISRQGYAVERQHVRMARRHARPSGVAADEKWLHVDLERQTLVAYEGDRAVFATLVSTGRAGYDTPTGLFHIQEKHKTATMRGSDASGFFEVSEVPWTMFYQGSYALHGAYWHDDFGNVRSHGCINLAPIDARWLFRFTKGELPSGWHALRHLQGTPLYVTRDG